jgi:hypothetical protein
MGQESCDIPVSDDQQHSWFPDSSAGTECGSDQQQGGGQCAGTLAQTGSFVGCSHAPKRMAAVATCYDLSITVFGQSWRKRQAALLVALLDVLQCTVFLMCVVWLRRKEMSEEASRTQVTAANFTIMVTNLPKDMAEADLDRALRYTHSLPIQRRLIHCPGHVHKRTLCQLMPCGTAWFCGMTR